MRQNTLISRWATLVVVLLVGRIGEARADEGPALFESRIRPFLSSHCLGCHSAKTKKGGLDMQRFVTLEHVRADIASWQVMLERLEDDEMPPKGRPRPQPQDLRLVITWIRDLLDRETKLRSGDPGPLLVRRLSNAEYDYTIRDLTGVDLRPAQQFPLSGAAGEGFLNANDALAISPELMDKYFSAAKETAAHAVLLPDGFRFSKSKTSEVWEQEILAEIREMYDRYATDRGEIPLDRYLNATIVHRDAFRADKGSFTKVARREGLSSKYLKTLWQTMTCEQPSFVLDPWRAKWKQAANPEDATGLVAGITRWQRILWREQTTQIGADALADRFIPVVDTQTDSHARLYMPGYREDQNAVLRLTTRVGPGREEQARIFLRNPQFESSGKPPLSLRDALRTTEESAGGQLPKLVQAKRGWTGNLTNKLAHFRGHKSLNGWGESRAAFLLTNQSDEVIRFGTPTVPARGVVVHPSSILDSLVAWRSPIDAQIRIEGLVADADKECGNGVVWQLELASKSAITLLARGVIENGRDERFKPDKAFDVEKDDVVLLVVSARDSDHRCDTTHIELKLAEVEGEKREWNLAEEIVDNILTGNPLPDSYGNAKTWNLDAVSKIPQTQSVLSSTDERWQSETILLMQGSEEIKVLLPGSLVTQRTFVVDVQADADNTAKVPVRFDVQRERVEFDVQRQASRLAVHANDEANRKEFLREAAEFRRVFPPRICHPTIIVTNAVALERFHRSDAALSELMLGRGDCERLDRLWSELHYASRDHLKVRDSFSTLVQGERKSWALAATSLRREIDRRAAETEAALLESEPKHVEHVSGFASRAYRRPLKKPEEQSLHELYRSLRQDGLLHEDALRTLLVRVLVSPSFLCRIEQPAQGQELKLVNDWELATRLSYFLWSSIPDEELRQVASAGRLHDPDVLAHQTRRMLQDGKTRALAIEFGTQWLGVRDFNEFHGKNQELFPSFNANLRQAMYEESILFFQDMIQADRPIQQLIDADHAFLNETLAAHYGIAGIKGESFRRVVGVRQYGRGGVLGLGSSLAKHSSASRTSPVLRGKWIVKDLLGERLPSPPEGVPELPDEETDGDLTIRQLVEKHASIQQCAVCHQRIDPAGFALEQFDTIGRWRDKDLGGRPVDAKARLKDGAEFEGIDGLKEYVLTDRKNDFVRQFCRKLLGYALGRRVVLSDQQLLKQIETELEKNDGRVSAAILAVVHSKQFRFIRGTE